MASLPWLYLKNKTCKNESECECNSDSHICTKKITKEEIINATFPPFKFELQIKILKSTINDFLKFKMRSILNGNGFTIFNLKSELKNEYFWEALDKRAFDFLSELSYYSNRPFDVRSHESFMRATALTIMGDFYNKEKSLEKWPTPLTLLTVKNMIPNSPYNGETIKILIKEMIIWQELRFYDKTLFESLLFLNDVFDPYHDKNLYNLYNDYRYTWQICVIEAIWNNGFFLEPTKIIDPNINSEKWKKLINNNIFTFNYDDMNEIIFNKTVFHINGSFNHVFKLEDPWERLFVSEKQSQETAKNYFIENNEFEKNISYSKFIAKKGYVTSAVLKSSIYKEDFKERVVKHPVYKESNDNFISNNDEAIIVFGTSMISDIYYFALLITRFKHIYWVDYDKNFEKIKKQIQQLEWLSYLYNFKYWDENNNVTINIIDFSNIEDYFAN